MQANGGRRFLTSDLITRPELIGPRLNIWLELASDIFGKIHAKSPTRGFYAAYVDIGDFGLGKFGLGHLKNLRFGARGLSTLGPHARICPISGLSKCK